MTQIGEELKKLRKRMRISQQKLGEKLNCAQTTIASLESGKRNPSYKMLQSIKELADSKRIKVDIL